MARNCLPSNPRLASEKQTLRICAIRSRAGSNVTHSTQSCASHLAQALSVLEQKSQAELNADTEEKRRRIDNIFETRRLAEKVPMIEECQL